MSSLDSNPVVEAPAKRPHLSPSQIGLYTKCGEAWRRRYIKKEVIPPGVALIKGSSLHRGAEHNFKQKIASREDLTPTEVVDYAVASFDTQVMTDGILLNSEEEAIGKSKVIGEAKDSTARLAGMFVKDIAPNYQPRDVEMQVRINLPTSTHDLLSIADMVTENDEIVELKTGKRWTQDKADANGQVTFQAMAFRAVHKKDPSKIVIENLVDNKTAVRNSLVTVRDEGDYEAMIARMNAVLDGINKGVYAPANEAGWWCSRNFCGYYSTCAYVKKRRV